MDCSHAAEHQSVRNGLHFVSHFCTDVKQMSAHLSHTVLLASRPQDEIQKRNFLPQDAYLLADMPRGNFPA